MITLALLQFIEDNGLGKIDEDLFWQNIGLDNEGIYVVSIGQTQRRGTRKVQRYELYSRNSSKLEGLRKLQAIIDLINASYEVCELPAVPAYNVNSYRNITLMPLGTPTRVGEDANGRIIWSITGEITF